MPELRQRDERRKDRSSLVENTILIKKHTETYYMESIGSFE
jgi:hypothetical protein